MTPDKEKLKLWVAALRSGEYTQAIGMLCQVDKDGGRRYCCLGVACEVAITNGLPLTRVTVQESSGIAYAPPEGIRSRDVLPQVLPQIVTDWYQLSWSNPLLQIVARLHPVKVPSSVTEHYAADLNDIYQLTFEDIADCIEHTYDLVSES